MVYKKKKKRSSFIPGLIIGAIIGIILGLVINIPLSEEELFLEKNRLKFSYDDEIKDICKQVGYSGEEFEYKKINEKNQPLRISLKCDDEMIPYFHCYKDQLEDEFGAKINNDALYCVDTTQTLIKNNYYHSSGIN